jgi:hypothetical protein
MSVEVSPLRVELRANPGGAHTQNVTLRNRGDAPVRIHASLEDWFLSRDGTPQFKPVSGTESFSASDWVRLSGSELVLQPGAEGNLRFTTTIPTGIDDGGYRAAVVFEFDPGSSGGLRPGGAVSFRSRIVTLVYATVGLPKVAIDLTDVRGRETDGRLTHVVIALRNTSRASARTKGMIVITDAGGKTVRKVELPDVPVLPASERDVAVEVSGGAGAPILSAGRYRIEVKLDVGMPDVLVGETTITVGK